MQQDDIMQQNPIVRGASIPPEVFKQQYRITRPEKLVEAVKGQVHSQTGRVKISASANDFRSLAAVPRRNGRIL
jgi:hypothetical protein